MGLGILGLSNHNSPSHGWYALGAWGGEWMPRAGAHKPTTKIRKLVGEASGYGMPYEQIVTLVRSIQDARAKPVSLDMLKYHYARELQDGQAQAAARVARSLYHRATGDDGQPADWRAAAWWLERRAGKHWAPEPSQVEIGRAGEFARLSDEELRQTIGELEKRLLPKPADQDD